MPKLYYTATSCGASSFIAAFTANVKLETEQVDIRSHQTASGVDFYTINPKGNVPTLVTDSGDVLNENIASLLFIADQNPGSVGAAPGTPERHLLVNALSYIASEVHPSIGCFFAPGLAEDVTAYFRDRVSKKLAYLESNFIGEKAFVVGDSFTVADSYLYICLTWTKYVGIDLSGYPHVNGYLERIGNLENVKAAHARIATSPATTI